MQNCIHGSPYEGFDPETVIEALVGPLYATLIQGRNIAAGTIVASDVADGAVTTAKIATDAVDGTKLADNAVNSEHYTDGSIDSVHVEVGLIQYVDVQLTNTNIKALNGTPITLVAAPGANKATVVHRVLIVCDAAAGAYVEPSAPDDLMIEYADGVDIFAAGVIEATALIAATVNVGTYGPLVGAVVPDVNAVVRIVNPNSDWTGGNAANTMSIRTWYSVVDTVAFT